MAKETYIRPEVEETGLYEAWSVLDSSPGGSLENPGSGDDFTFGW